MRTEEQKAKQNLYARRWRAKHKEHVDAYRKQYEADNRERNNAQAARSHRKSMRAMRRRVTDAMGGKCQDCGLDDQRVLQIHHANFDGAEARRTGPSGYSRQYYLELLRLFTEVPGSLALVCANCHLIRHWKEDDD